MGGERTMTLPRGGVRAKLRHLLDLFIVLDCTSSMGPVFKKLQKILREFFGELGGAGIDFAATLIEFRDLKTMHEPILIHGPTSSVTELKRVISGLRDEGGGDEPESQIDAMAKVTELGLRPGATRVAVLITDATPHDPDASGLTMPELVELLARHRVVSYVVGPDIPKYRSLAESFGGIHFNLEDDPAGFKKVILTLGKSISETVAMGPDLRGAASRALGRTKSY